jgi:hypothetical protein
MPHGLLKTMQNFVVWLKDPDLKVRKGVYELFHSLAEKKGSPLTSFLETQDEKPDDPQFSQILRDLASGLTEKDFDVRIAAQITVNALLQRGKPTFFALCYPLPHFMKIRGYSQDLPPGS